MTLSKTILATAIGVALGGSANAAIVSATFNAWFTLVNQDGVFITNSDSAGNAFLGQRTAIEGNLSFSTTTGLGSASFSAFSFFGQGFASVTDASFEEIGDGTGGPGSLMLANMNFDWNGTSAPVSVVWDAAGFLDAGGLTETYTSGQVITGGTAGATDNTLATFSSGPSSTSYTLPIGAVPISTTTFNTTPLGGGAGGSLPLISDSVVDATNGDVGIGGSPFLAGPFTNFNANFDFSTINVISSVPEVPIPGAVWLFSSGLLGLIAAARRRQGT